MPNNDLPEVTDELLDTIEKRLAEYEPLGAPDDGACPVCGDIIGIVDGVELDDRDWCWLCSAALLSDLHVDQHPAFSTILALVREVRLLRERRGALLDALLRACKLARATLRDNGAEEWPTFSILTTAINLAEPVT